MKSETLAIHGGFAGDSVTGATASPIYQTVSYAYGTAQELADVFDGISPGYIYTRIANPTTTALEARLAELEDGIGAIATSSGMAAIASVVMGLVRAGDKIVAAAGIFGGTVSLFEKTLGRFGVESLLERPWAGLSQRNGLRWGERGRRRLGLSRRMGLGGQSPGRGSVWPGLGNAVACRLGRDGMPWLVASVRPGKGR